MVIMEQDICLVLFMSLCFGKLSLFCGNLFSSTFYIYEITFQNKYISSRLYILFLLGCAWQCHYFLKIFLYFYGYHHHFLLCTFVLLPSFLFNLYCVFFLYYLVPLCASPPSNYHTVVHVYGSFFFFFFA